MSQATPSRPADVDTVRRRMLADMLADPSLSPSLRSAQAAASRLTTEELESFRAWPAAR